MAGSAGAQKWGIGWHGENVAVIAVCVAAVVYVCALLVLNYRSDRQLQDTALQKLSSETEKLADSVGYFFEERKDDLLNLGLSREVAVFFENRDLGMSKQYGLNLSLPPIADRFKALMERKKFAGKPVYIRVALIDKSGEVLADTAAGLHQSTRLPQFLDPAQEQGAIKFMRGSREPLTTLAYYFKGLYAGQLVAWLAPETLAAQLPGSADREKEATWLSARDEGRHRIIAPQNLHETFSPGFDVSGIGLPEPGSVTRFTAPDPRGENEAWLCTAAPVRGSPCRIIRAVQAESGFGRFTSRWYFAGMASLAVVILCGAVFSFMLSLRARLLQVRLEESLRREAEIQDKERALSQANRELTSEIAIRESIREELMNSHAQLEQRVEERTAELQHSLQEKNVLIREVHHRVKNNLQVITSLLNLQAYQTRNAEVIDSLENTKNRVYSMAMLHESLYLSDNLARIKLSDYIERLASHLTNTMESTAGIKIKSGISEIYLQIEQAVPCGLMINELVTNAMKHAFPGSRTGSITLSFGVRTDGRIGISISDDGIGLPPDMDIRTTGSLGLKLVHMLINQLGGELHIRRQSGTEFHIMFQANQRSCGVFKNPDEGNTA